MCNRSSDQSSLIFNLNNNEGICNQYPLFLPIIIGIISLIGTIFSIIDLKHYFLKRDLHTYFNYIYHYMLFFCLSHSILYIPGFYVGIYFSWFNIYPIFCILFQIHAYSIFTGLAYLLMWTSLERHRYLFQINRRLSYSRQIFPLIIIIIFSYVCSILIIILPKCSKQDITKSCFIQKFSNVILFALFTFVIPIITMICSTGILLWRLYEHRTRLNKRRRWIRLKRMFYQSIIYFIWYCLAYWPYTIYSLLISYDSNRFDSIILKSISYLISIYVIQTLPILTYFIFQSNNKKRRQNNYAISSKIDVDINKQPIWIFNWFQNKKQPPIVERF